MRSRHKRYHGDHIYSALYTLNGNTSNNYGLTSGVNDEVVRNHLIPQSYEESSGITITTRQITSKK